MHIVIPIIFFFGLMFVRPEHLPPFLRIFQQGLRNTIIFLKPFLITAIIIFVGGALFITYEDQQKKKKSIADYEESQRQYQEAENNVPKYGSDEYHSWSYMHPDKAKAYELKLNGQDSTGRYILNPHPANSIEAKTWVSDSIAFEERRVEEQKRDQFVAKLDSLAAIK